MRSQQPVLDDPLPCSHPASMKKLHRNDLYSWSVFNTDRNIDFNSFLWVRDGGNVLIDPLPLSDHDREHLMSLGGAAIIVVTNSDHVRASAEIAAATQAEIFGPAAERDGFPTDCARWLAPGDDVVAGLEVLTVEGSKTPGELVLLLEGTTLFTGDLIRCHQAGRLCLLPDAKLSDRAAAIQSVGALAENKAIEAVLLGDGFSIFRDGHARLSELAASA